MASGCIQQEQYLDVVFMSHSMRVLCKGSVPLLDRELIARSAMNSNSVDPSDRAKSSFENMMR